jgi:hypothetical protein
MRKTRVPVIVKPFYTVFLENYRDASIIHCDVYKWTPAIRRSLQEDFGLLVYLKDDPIYAFHEIGDKKHKKFLELFGFVFVERVLGSDLKYRELYVRN